MTTSEIIDELRELIIKAAPNPRQAEPVRSCRDDVPLDGLIPFSSLIVLGVVVVVEDRFGCRITRDVLARACSGGATLRRLAVMIEELDAESLARR
jgi:acyl carrier protein